MRGFTLLEVLVALVIVGLGMMAVFTQLNQSLSAASRLRDKTIANWVAVDRITELRVTGGYPKIGQLEDEIQMANSTWLYTIDVSQTPVDNLRRLDVSVSFVDTPDDILAEVAGFVSPVGQTPLPPIGWTLPIDPDAIAIQNQTQGLTQ